MATTRTEFDTFHNSGDYLMKVNNLSVGLNMPAALKSVGEGKNEKAHGLPSYRPRKAYLVDEYPACPKDWLRSSGRIKSFFVPIVEGAGLWLDCNQCFTDMPQHVAVVVSVQGVNALTGLPCKDATLEQYKDECPKHKKPFGPDRLCTDCDFKWPKQNYLATTGQPQSELWLDGFRAEDGFIRQYVFTAQKMRSIAKAVIGEDRVFALGISFFLSKQPKPAPSFNVTRGLYKGGGGALNFMDSDMKWGSCCTSEGPIGAALSNDEGSFAAGLNDTVLYEKTLNMDKSAAPSATTNISVKHVDESSRGVDFDLRKIQICASTAHAPVQAYSVKVEHLEIAAGARVNQRIYDDPNDLEFWQKEPEGLIVINYCTEEDAQKIIAAGKLDLSGSKDGFMGKLPVGNP